MMEAVGAVTRQEVVGSVPDHLESSSEHLTMVFSSATVSVTQRWKNKNLSADFLADYFANFFPGANGSAVQTATQAEIRGAVGFIANELLENALKFNHDPSYNMRIHLRLYPDRLIMLSTNSVDPAAVPDLQAYVTELLSGDPGEMYIAQLERSAAEDSQSSRMGFLSMLNDYDARLGWRFEWLNSPARETVLLTTLVTINV